MKSILTQFLIVSLVLITFGCGSLKTQKKDNKLTINANLTAVDILGNPKYLAISYSGFRQNSRDIEPTIPELKEDMKILSASGIKVLRTYNVQLKEAANILETIRQLKKEDNNFEMYVMLGAWIDCQNAWTSVSPNHDIGSEANASEIERAVELANQYPDIVKIISVGNEAMVKWATSYFVQPEVILKWVNHLQELKKTSKLPPDLWITSSDNFASWGGGDPMYHVADLEKLINAVDFISIHTYPMHDTHYNPAFWGVLASESNLTEAQKIDAAMFRAKEYARSQYDGVYKYMKSLGVNKPIHIGETGWASASNEHYGNEGSKATDEYKEAIFYNYMRDWTNKAGMSCFFFEAFDEQWKDANNPLGSENHFGLFTVSGQAKYALWNLVDEGVFKGLSRNGNKITKTFNGNKEELMKGVLVPKAMH